MKALNLKLYNKSKNIILLSSILLLGLQLSAQNANDYYNSAVQSVKSKSITQAKKQLEIAAGQNHPQALYLLGSIYYHGDATNRDYWTPISNQSQGYSGYNGNIDLTEAFINFYLAAVAGSPDGMHAIGVMYQKGEALSKEYIKVRNEYYDYVNSPHYVKKDDDIDSKAAALAVDMITESREKTRDTPTALYWYERAGGKNYPLSMYYASLLLIEGKDGIEKNERKAFEWLAKGAAAGDKDCTRGLAAAYETGFQTQKDLPKALALYRKAVELGDQTLAPALLRLRAVLEVDENGQLKDYFDNGKLWRLRTFKDGIPHGRHEYHYMSGSSEIGLYNNGEKDGEWIEKHDNGQISSIKNYDNGKQVGEVKTYFENGQPKEVGHYQNGNKEGEWKEYDEKGVLQIEGSYVKGREHGEWKHYHDNKNPKSAGMYQNGLRVGEWKEFHDNGKRKSIGFYKIFNNGRNRKDGEWKYYDEKGKLSDTEIYKDGEPIKR